ncbi:hemin uptake protein HemP [Halomonas sp. BLK-85]
MATLAILMIMFIINVGGLISFDMDTSSPHPSSDCTSRNRFSDDRCAEIRSEDLLDSNGQRIIRHQQKRYILRRTKSGKLILTT